MGAEHGARDTLDAEVVAFCAQLIRFDTTNFGAGEARGERPAAEWVAQRLTEVGYAPELIESAPSRASVLLRIPGRDRRAPGLLVHGHLDVVPADPEHWSVDPFGGVIADGAVWGRGALDMKGTDATMLAVARSLARSGARPHRDLVMAWVADEEDTGRYGAGHIVEHRPDLLAGISEAIGESGGTLTPLPNGGHLYPVITAERGTAWIELIARGPAGHGSRPRPDNAVAVLAQTVTRLSAIEWPTQIIPAVGALVSGLAEALGVQLDPTDPGLPARVGAVGPLLAATRANSLSPTMLEAGAKANVIPAEARAVLDGRMLPGTETEFLAQIDAVLGTGVTRRMLSHEAPIAADPHSPELAVMAAALRSQDPAALVLPACSGGGTDAKWWHRLGISCYGFAPAGLEALGADGSSLVHGIDERVSVESLIFGARVLEAYLLSTGA